LMNNNSVSAVNVLLGDQEWYTAEQPIMCTWNIGWCLPFFSNNSLLSAFVVYFSFMYRHNYAENWYCENNARKWVRNDSLIRQKWYFCLPFLLLLMLVQVHFWYMDTFLTDKGINDGQTL
jgi:hypothetical protein